KLHRTDSLTRQRSGSATHNNAGTRWFPPSASAFPVDGAFVPLVQQQPGKGREEHVDGDTGQRQQEEAGEHARDVEPVLSLENAKSEDRKSTRLNSSHT